MPDSLTYKCVCERRNALSKTSRVICDTSTCTFREVHLMKRKRALVRQQAGNEQAAQQEHHLTAFLDRSYIPKNHVVAEMVNICR